MVLILLAFGAVAAAAQMAGPMVAIGCGLAFFAIGMAHGTVDGDGDKVAPLGLAQAGAYLLVGVAMAAAYLAFPLAGLTLFLALSAWHFGRSDIAIARPARWAVAALATGGSALFRPDATAATFAAMTEVAIPAPAIWILASIGVAGVILTIETLMRRRDGGVTALAAIAAVALLDPVLAVGFIFVTAHALPVQYAQARVCGWRRLAAMAALPTAIALAGGALLVAAVWSGMIALSVAVALAFGLATPHMLTERLDR